MECINDLNGNIVNFFEVLRTNKAELVQRLKESVISRELFLKYREDKWESLEPAERAFRFFYITKCSYGGLFRFNKQGVCNSPFAGSPDPKARITLYTDNTLKQLEDAHKRIQNATIECLDYKDIIRLYDRPTTVFFFDPPYGTDYNYGIKFDYDELLQQCRGMKGKFILTLNGDMEQKFKEFNIIHTTVNYSVTCKAGDNAKDEIIVRNYA